MVRGKPLRPELAASLRRAAARQQRAAAERDQLIVQALDEGASTRDIAEAAGMTHTGVRMVARRLGRAPD